jgi:hypothetical protein
VQCGFTHCAFAFSAFVLKQSAVLPSHDGKAARNYQFVKGLCKHKNPAGAACGIFFVSLTVNIYARPQSM